MRRISWLAAVPAAVVVCSASMPIPGDAGKGAELFKTQKCITCHSVNGEGGRSAPDLGRRSGQSYTPALLASLMWNHAPQMWAAIEKAGVARPNLSNEQAADLFAYFYAVRYFEKPGDAGRGKALFAARGCAGCHGIDSPVAGGGKPVSQWEGVSDPIALAQGMWNHASAMRSAIAGSKGNWPALTGQELTDIVVYIQNLPQTRGKQPKFSPASAETGELLFEVKGCTGCHKGATGFDNRFAHRSLADFSAAMWNHSAKMKQLPALNGEEMRRIVGFLWSKQFFETRGNAARGKLVFSRKRCADCHAGGGAPALAGARTSPFTIVSALWEHGPDMMSQMKSKGIAWPRFTNPAEMSDLIAFLNTSKQ